MRIIYRRQVRAQCPVNPSDRDLYSFVIESESIIEVEQINAFFKKHAGRRKIFQEALTQLCAVTLGAKVTSKGVHSGVEVECTAP